MPSPSPQTDSTETSSSHPSISTPPFSPARGPQDSTTSSSDGISSAEEEDGHHARAPGTHRRLPHKDIVEDTMGAAVAGVKRKGALSVWDLAFGPGAPSDPNANGESTTLPPLRTNGNNNSQNDGKGSQGHNGAQRLSSPPKAAHPSALTDGRAAHAPKKTAGKGAMRKGSEEAHILASQACLGPCAMELTTPQGELQESSQRTKAKSTTSKTSFGVSRNLRKKSPAGAKAQSQAASTLAGSPTAPSTAPIGPTAPSADSASNPEAGSKAESATTTAAAAPSPPKRKSRVLRRKTDHSVIERRRREKINERLIRLQEIVPACRQEVEEIFKRKGPKAKHQDFEKVLAEDMVLEKLCIISHTVDYVFELQAQLEAYRRMCRCSPPLSVPTPPDPSQHERFAHEHLDPSLDSTASAAGPRGLNEQTPRGTGTPGTRAKVVETVRKRKRHWGSNAPPRGSPVRVVKAVPPPAESSSQAEQEQEQERDSEDEDQEGSDEEDELVEESLTPHHHHPAPPHRAWPATTTHQTGTPDSTSASTSTSTRARKRRATDAGHTYDGPATMHACGHAHPPGGAPGFPYHSGASHSHSHAHAHAQLYALRYPHTLGPLGHAPHHHHQLPHRHHHRHPHHHPYYPPTPTSRETIPSVYHPLGVYAPNPNTNPHVHAHTNAAFFPHRYSHPEIVTHRTSSSPVSPTSTTATATAAVTTLASPPHHSCSPAAASLSPSDGEWEPSCPTTTTTFGHGGQVDKLSILASVSSSSSRRDAKDRMDRSRGAGSDVRDEVDEPVKALDVRNVSAEAEADEENEAGADERTGKTSQRQKLRKSTVSPDIARSDAVGEREREQEEVSQPMSLTVTV